MATYGIRRKISCPYTTQQNGLVERKHMHIIEIGLALLAYSLIPIKFYDDAFYVTVYIIKKFPNSVLNFQSPYELFYKTKPSYVMLKIFRYISFLYLRTLNTYKFDFKINSCTFLVYSLVHKGYKCLILNGKVLILRNVLFHENTFPFAACSNTSAPTDL